MKLIEIKNLTEQVKAFTGNDEDMDAELEYIIQNIKRDCKPFIKAGLPYLWRGLEIEDSMIRKLSHSFYIGSVRNDRKPTHTPEDVQKVIDEYFISKVGIPVRAASLFVTGDLYTAKHYGETYLIIPIGEFHFAWSPLVADFYNTFIEGVYDISPTTKLGKMIDIEFEKAGIDREDMDSLEGDSEKFTEFYRSLFKNHGDEIFHFDGSIEDAADSKNEIMLVCDKYYLIDVNELEDGYKGLFNKLK